MNNSYNKKILNRIKIEALENKIPIILDDTLDVIQELLLKLKPKKILEIGTATGYSAICFSNILNNDVIIDTIEIDEKRVEKAKENILKMKIKNINIKQGDALEILPKLNSPYDCIFIDSVKSKYPIFLIEAIRLSKIGTYILADNILYKGYVLGEYNKHKQRTAVRNLREYIKEISINENLETKILEVGDGLSITKVIKKV